MKILLISFIFSSSVSFAQKAANTNENIAKGSSISFPTNFDERDFKKIELFKRGIIAFDGVIEEVEESAKSTPFYYLKVGEDKYLWSVLMFKNESNERGDTIRVVAI